VWAWRDGLDFLRHLPAYLPAVGGNGSPAKGRALTLGEGNANPVLLAFNMPDATSKTGTKKRSFAANINRNQTANEVRSVLRTRCAHGVLC